MMSFGWRPMLSCYASNPKTATGQNTASQQAIDQATNAVAAGVATPDQQAIASVSCPSPTWFYTLLVIGVAAGLMKGRA